MSVAVSSAVLVRESLEAAGRGWAWRALTDGLRAFLSVRCVPEYCCGMDVWRGDGSEEGRSGCAGGCLLPRTHTASATRSLVVNRQRPHPAPPRTTPETLSLPNASCRCV